jgi:hypothetical protein
MMGVYIQQLWFIPQLNQIMESTSIFSKDIITPPLVPHGISFTCKSNKTRNGTNFQTFQNGSKHKWVKSSSTLHNHAKAMRKVSYRKIAERKPISSKNLLMLENSS